MSLPLLADAGISDRQMHLGQEAVLTD